MAIPSSSISWTASGTSNGTAYPGTLSAIGFVPVLQGNPDATSASTNITWTLDTPPDGVKAGVHILSATWKIESLAP